MKIKEISDYLETIAPIQLQESYDNSGFIVGNKDWDINNLDKSIKTPKRPASFYKLPKEKQGEVLFNEFSSGKPNETFGLKGKSETFWDRYTEPGYKPKTVFEEFMFENYGKEIKQFKEKLTKQIRDSIKDDKDVWSAELWNARRGVIPPIECFSHNSIL